MHPLLNGSDSWRDTGNWRDAVSASDLAVSYLMPIAENEAMLRRADFRTLGEIVAAAGFLNDLPIQMRGNSCNQLNQLIKEAPSGPRRGIVRGLVSFAVNPVGSTLNAAVNQLGKSILKNEDTVSEFASLVEASAVDAQLEYIWTHANQFPYDQAFDQETGRRAYWFSFIYNDSNHLSRFPSDFVLTHEVANQSLQRSQSDLYSLRNNPNALASLWSTSPLFSTNDVVANINRINETDRVARKLSRGKTIDEVEQAYQFHRQNIDNRERHIHGYAIRMRWSS